MEVNLFVPSINKSSVLLLFNIKPFELFFETDKFVLEVAFGSYVFKESELSVFEVSSIIDINFNALCKYKSIVFFACNRTDLNITGDIVGISFKQQSDSSNKSQVALRAIKVAIRV
ncbi:unnamed protein product [Pneumocystis jirovecii]|uniref:Uncharacterized protein n=1 Tax=Pneumocystis jirovecii TaxID=42068 RepID=L0PF11_PNEJI|nr:unnamed protein product [Pneumocystis jirovecii]